MLQSHTQSIITFHCWKERKTERWNLTPKIYNQNQSASSSACPMHVANAGLLSSEKSLYNLIMGFSWTCPLIWHLSSKRLQNSADCLRNSAYLRRVEAYGKVQTIPTHTHLAPQGHQHPAVCPDPRSSQADPWHWVFTATYLCLVNSGCLGAVFTVVPMILFSSRFPFILIK